MEDEIKRFYLDIAKSNYLYSEGELHVSDDISAEEQWEIVDEIRSPSKNGKYTIEKDDQSCSENANSAGQPVEKEEAAQEYAVREKSCERKTTLKLKSAVVKIGQNWNELKSADYEDEEEDINDKGWDRLRNLTTDEEWYLEVKRAWDSKTTPNPHKNLSCHSFRKRNFTEAPRRLIVQKKRSAPADSESPRGKRFRSCTFNLDKKIDEVNKENEDRQNFFVKSMHKKLDKSTKLYNDSEVEVLRRRRVRVDSDSPVTLTPITSAMLSRLWSKHREDVDSITSEYWKLSNKCVQEFSDEIGHLNEVRDELLFFNNFYRSEDSSKGDPSKITGRQLKEVEEIENVFHQFSRFYEE